MTRFLPYVSIVLDLVKTFWTLYKKFRYKRDGTSHISHLSGAKCKCVLLQSWHVVESRALQTKHASKSFETKIYDYQNLDINCKCFNRTFLAKIKRTLSLMVV